MVSDKSGKSNAIQRPVQSSRGALTRPSRRAPVWDPMEDSSEPSLRVG